MGNFISELEVDELEKQLAIKLNVTDNSKDGLEQVAKWIEKGKAKNILVLCGAGVSVSAGIPDFRSPGTGLYDNLQKYDLPWPQAIFELDFYRKKPEAFCTLAKELWPGMIHSPTLTHSFLKLLSDKGILLRNYTQNIDGLDHLAGIPEEKLVECHGHFRTASCIRCHKTADPVEVRDTIVGTGKTPLCSECGSYVKPDIVFFGEGLPSRFHSLLSADIQKADLMLILGTSLQVAPVSMIPSKVRCTRVLFNRELSLDPLRSSDIFVEGDCDDTILKLCSILGWGEELKKQNENTRIQLANSVEEGNDERKAEQSTHA